MAETNEQRERRIDFRAGDLLPGDEDYRILHDTGQVSPEGGAVPINEGSAGVVYFARFKGLMDRAIKFLDPRREFRERAMDEFLTTFRKEIRILARVTHTRVSKITDLGTYSADGDEFPWYAMEYIRGEELATPIWRHPQMTGLRFLDLFDQLLDGLGYLHSHWIMHCDVKDGNVLVLEHDGRFSLTLVDLGVAKVVRETALGLPADEHLPGLEDVDLGDRLSSEDITLFFSTKRIVKPAWQGRVDRPITRAELQEMFPSHDLHGVGLLIEDGLADEQLRARLRRDLGESGVAALERVKDRLLCEPGEEYYTRVEQLREDWAKLDPGYLSPLKIPELAVAAEARTSLATPTGRVSLSARMVETLNQPAMQRLRNIPQLEFAQLIYPGATHTRLLHGLSAFDAARRFIAHLLNDPEFRLMVDKADIEAVLLWALTHDIGHYPLSHMFEDLSQEQRSRHGEKRTIPTDDDLFWAFVDPGNLEASDVSDFASYAETVDGQMRNRDGQSFAEFLLESAHFEPEALKRLAAIKSPETFKDRLLRGIVASHIDVDKVAYLTDDSAMSGVRYGLGMDLDALLSSLRVPREADLPRDEDGDLPPGVIAINDKGLPAAEGVILARYWMLRRVYWHHTNRAVIAMSKYVISRLLDAERLDMEDFCQRMISADARAALADLASAFDLALDEGALEERARNPLHGILGGQRQIYKRLLTIARGRDPKRYEQLAFKESRDLAPLVTEVEEILRAKLPDEVELLPGDVIIDVPLKQREEPDAPLLVYLHGEPQGKLIEEQSPVIRSLRDEFDAHVKKCRVFVHPDIAAALGPAQIDSARDAVRALLKPKS